MLEMFSISFSILGCLVALPDATDVDRKMASFQFDVLHEDTCGATKSSSLKCKPFAQNFLMENFKFLALHDEFREGQ